MKTIAPPHAGAIGKPESRLDGQPKVTGSAQYAADHPVESLTYGVFALATIPSGRIRALDTAAAERAPGVLRVLTHANMPRLNPVPSPPLGQGVLPLQDDRIYHEGQPIALVIASTLETALHAATLVRAEYDREDFRIDFRASLDDAESAQSFDESDTRIGDVDATLGQAPVRIAATYRTADRHHVPMEPSATIAAWRGGKLEMEDAVQWVWGVRMAVAMALGIQPDDIRVRCPYTGGGFGCKGYIWPHQILTAVAAREVGRPVKTVLTRAQTFTAHGYQPATEQNIELGAARDGRLLAMRHTCVNPTSIPDGYLEFGALATRSLYACQAIETRHRVVHVHRGTPTPMRAPHEGPGIIGLECALDELAYELGIDPVELRLKNDTQRDPTSDLPFSSRALDECYRQGAERFDWQRRDPRPGSMRDGHDLVGLGVASAMMSTFRFGAAARVTIDRAGNVLVEAGSQEIGTGVYTIMPQIAAETLGVPIERVRLHLGDTTLPETGGTFGSSTTIGVGSAVQDAAQKLRAKLEELAAEPLPVDVDAYVALLRRHGLERLAADGSWSPEGETDMLGRGSYAMASFGAVFVEVRVDEDLRIPRVSRCLGVYSAGRIINPKTARSQMIGGMVWGIGQALLEDSAMDAALGRYLSKNLAGYLVPVNADVPQLEAYFVEEVDPHASAVGARGIGELGAVGVGAAILNGIYHATGRRIREVPVHPELLL